MAEENGDKLPTKKQLQELAKDVNSRAHVKIVKELPETLTEGDVVAVADEKITGDMIAQNTVKSDNIDWATLSSFIVQAGLITIPDNYTETVTGNISIRIPLTPAAYEKAKDKICQVIMFSGWGYTAGVSPGIQWVGSGGGHPDGPIASGKFTGRYFLPGGLHLGSLQLKPHSDLVYMVVCSPHPQNYNFDSVLKSTNLKEGETTASDAEAMDGPSL